MSDMNNKEQAEQKVDHKDFIFKRVGGYLHKVVPIRDATGKVLQHVLVPFHGEFKFRDFFQIVAGASLLMVPVAFTEEVWNLSEQLPIRNILWLVLLSVATISLFVYFNFYRNNFKGQIINYLKRTITTYVVALTVAGIFLTIIDKCPWGVDNIIAIKRIILVAFPASMGGTISDTLK